MRAGRLATGMAVIALGLAASAWAQELSVSASAGGLIPSGDSYRQIYGSSFVVAGEVWLKLRGPLGLATGFGLLSDEGLAAGPSDLYPVKYRRLTVPLVLFYQFDLGPADLRAGGGACIHGIRETWQTVALDYSGREISPRFLLAISVEVVRRLSLFSSVTYDLIHEESPMPSPYSSEVDLSGVQVVAGVAFRIF